jgi:hypothetical protein
VDGPTFSKKKKKRLSQLSARHILTNEELWGTGVISQLANRKKGKKKLKKKSSKAKE